MSESPAPAVPTPAQRSLPGLLLRGAALFLLATSLAWFASPWFMEPLLQRALPEGWQVELHDPGRPGLRQIGVAGGRLSGRLPGLNIEVEWAGLIIRYARPEVSAQTVRVHAIPAAMPSASGPLRLTDLALPRLVMPVLDTAVEIDRLELLLGSGDSAVAGVIEPLTLDGASDRLRWEAVLAPNALLKRASLIRLDWTTEYFLLDWLPCEENGPAWLHFEERNGDSLEAPAEGRLEIDLDLAHLEPEILGRGLNVALGLSAGTTATGQLSAELLLQGFETLRPVQASVVLDAVQLMNQETRIGMDVSAQAQLNTGTPMLEIDHLLVDSEGPLPALNELLGALLEDWPIEGLDLGAPFSFNAIAPLAPSPSLQLHLGEAGGSLIAASGGLQLDTYDTGTHLSLALPEFSWTSDGNAIDAQGVALTLKTDRTVIYTLESGEIGFSAAEVVLAGDVSNVVDTQGGGTRFQGHLEIAEFIDFSAGQPAATARLRTLGFSGPLEFGLDHLRFDGVLGGAGLVVAPADAVASNTLMIADSVTAAVLAEGITETELNGTGRINGLSLPDLGVRADGLELSLESLMLPALNSDLRALTTGLEVNHQGTRYSGLDVEVDGELLNGRYLQGMGNVLIGLTGELPFRFVVDLDLPTLEAKLEDAAISASALPDAARALALPLPESLSFDGGDLVLDGEVSYADDALRGAIDVRGDALSLGLGESRIEGLDFRTRVALADLISGGGPLALEIASLAAGLDMTTLTTSVEFAGSDFGLLSLQAGLLGGELRSPALKLSGGQLQQSLVEWSGFDLGQLLSFVDVSGLEGTGTLDAELPIINDGSGPAVNAGRFAARAPGLLRYSTGIPASNIGLQALENFQYDTLEGQLDYASDGAYTIALDLLGRNPDLYGGHPVRFRLNLGGEMPALFRSLFITGNFEEAILEQLRSVEPTAPEYWDAPDSEP